MSGSDLDFEELIEGRLWPEIEIPKILSFLLLLVDWLVALGCS